MLGWRLRLDLGLGLWDAAFDHLIVGVEIFVGRSTCGWWRRAWRVVVLGLEIGDALLEVAEIVNASLLIDR